MLRSRCCGTSVGVIVTDKADNLLMITRGWFPVGVAPVAGHIADEHTDPMAALVAEVREETGLDAISRREVWRGWLPNVCASPPASIPGHHWVLAVAGVSGALAPDPVETRGAAWYTPAQVCELASRTLAYARGEISDQEFEESPGLEPVWLELLHAAGRLEVTQTGRALARRLYTTPPQEYWLGEDEGLVPAAQLAACS
ncbi:ADP-ribose pyrophosphatase YjhB (NUDIX family) [Streptomonospora nanhaiensis]|uniref:ADP-ribose pyrophosphatase YjhB (NUDIX family) n=1 Tax=Streptomonospora nanhaiensis TaxID=1323731 RepID=A0A853BMJ2_9ACTN|nr:NUDIX hydrolase [Streptomonospora nanhaiensis]NYI95914.1 ADP-ribose pyrophosphatase YjhB (NUDIX family) [Streptomonospora nanhaiensis]